MRAFRIAGLLLLLTSWSLSAWAQYFGRNKVQYESFNWRVLRTPHFEIYYYPEEEVAVRDAARMAERWYQRHSRTFLHEFGERKPIIFYADDADFHQTNAISGEIGEGTGGVTEAIKERVIMPFTGIYRENDHVLGHELVHSFQYDIALNRSDSLSRFNLALLPLWLVEGMAEYLSLGRNDPHTAMWLRDAALRDDLPTIRQLTRDLRYFPYRYGQAYLAYIGGKYGDQAVTELYKLGGIVGVDTAITITLGITPDSLSREWIQAVKNTYLPLLKDRTPPRAGRTKGAGARHRRGRDQPGPGAQSRRALRGLPFGARPVHDRPVRGRRRDRQGVASAEQQCQRSPLRRDPLHQLLGLLVA